MQNNVPQIKLVMNMCVNLKTDFHILKLIVSIWSINATFIT